MPAPPVSRESELGGRPVVGPGPCAPPAAAKSFTVIFSRGLCGTSHGCAGVPVGVKESGGVLEYHARALKVRCLPTSIPASIDVDVTALNVGDNLHVRDIKAEGYTIVSDGDVTVAAVVLRG